MIHLAFIEDLAAVDLATVIVCLLVILVAAAGQTIVRGLLKLIPTVNVPLVGDIFAPLKERLHLLEVIFADMLEGAGDALAYLLRETARIAKILFGDIATQATHVWDEVEHLVDTNIPRLRGEIEAQIGSSVHRERTRAEHGEHQATIKGEDAQQHVHQLRHRIETEQIKPLNGQIAHARETAVHEANTHAHDELSQRVRELVEALGGSWGGIHPLQQAVAVTIPREIAAKAHAEAQVVQDNLNNLKAQLQASIDQLQRRLESTQHELQAAQAALTTAQTQIATLQREQPQDVKAIETAQAAAIAAGAAAAALQPRTSQLERELAAANGELGRITTTETLTLQPSPELGIPSSITIPAAVGALGAAVAKITMDLEDCVITECGSGPNQLGNALRRLLGLTGDLAAFGMLAEAIAKPVGTADTLQPLFDTVDTGAQEAWRAILELV